MQAANTLRSIEQFAHQRSISSEVRNAILLERARRLAAIDRKGDDDSANSQVIVFGLEAERYAIETAYVKEVYPLIDVTFLPCVPPWIHGVINVRRKIYSIVDLKQFFHLSSKEELKENRVIILEDGNIAFGILSDEIYGVQALSVAKLQPELPTHTRNSKEYLKGITQDRIVVLNGAKLLHSDSIIVNEAVNDSGI